MCKVVLIGCGHMGAVHLDDVYTNENINIYGIVDIDSKRVKFFAKKYCADGYDTDFMHYIHDKNTDIIICATYPAWKCL